MWDYLIKLKLMLVTQNITQNSKKNIRHEIKISKKTKRKTKGKKTTPSISRSEMHVHLSFICTSPSKELLVWHRKISKIASSKDLPIIDSIRALANRTIPSVHLHRRKIKERYGARDRDAAKHLRVVIRYARERYGVSRGPTKHIIVVRSWRRRFLSAAALVVAARCCGAVAQGGIL
jgi:hypothetical protein